MTVVISDDFVVSPGADDFNTNNPIIGYQNLVTTANIFTTTEDTDFPAVNLANPATRLKWQGVLGSPSSDEYITVVVNSGEDIDYLAVARHNFGTGVFQVSVEGLAEADDSPAEWFELVGSVLLANDNPVIFRFTPQSLFSIRLRIQPSLATIPVEPTAAVVYVGKLLVLQRRIYVGHTPVPYGRQNKIVNGRSESGNFLGRIVLGGMVKTTIKLDNLTPGWYRTYLDPFLIAAIEIPFFFNWRPGTYPYESGYVWMTNDPNVVNQRPNGMVQIQMEVAGIVT
jgi:hypothetical protein